MASLHLLLFLVVLLPCAIAQITWRQPSDEGLSAVRSRWRAAMAHDSANDRLLLFGGLGSNETLGDMFEYGIGSGMWQALSDAGAPSPRYGCVSGVVDDRWFISHGRDDDVYFDETWVYDMSTGQWSQLNTTDAPRARYGSAGGTYRGSSLLWLNMGLGEGGRLLSDTWTLNTTSGQWTEVSSGGGLNQYDPFSPHARRDHAGAPLSHNTFAIFGGCADGGQVGGPCPLEDSWLLSLEDGDWELIHECPTPRIGGVMVQLGEEGMGVMIQGDQDNGPGVFPQRLTGTILVPEEVNWLNSTSDTWKRFTNSSDAVGDLLQRELPSVVVDYGNGDVYMFGGRRAHESQTLLNELWVMEFEPSGVEETECSDFTVTYLDLHGILMGLAWLVCLPLGALLGRYYRWAWPCWFVTHVLVQALGVLFTIAAFIIVFLVASYDQPNFPHAIVGIILTVILLQQFLNGIFHPCVESENGKTPSDEKSVFRKCWEVYHAVSGLVTITIGFGQVILGMFLIILPLAWWAAVCAVVFLWIVMFVVHEIFFQCCKLCRKSKETY